MYTTSIHDGPCCPSCREDMDHPWIDDDSVACCCGADGEQEHRKRRFGESTAPVCVACAFLYVVPGEKVESAESRRLKHVERHKATKTPVEASIWWEGAKEREEHLIQMEHERTERMRVEDANLDPNSERFRQRDAERQANREKREQRIVRRQYFDHEGFLRTEYEGEET
jgi:hypothetical protein